MENVFIAGDEDTPEIDLNFSEKKFIISGKSLPEDVTEFYNPIFENIKAYFAENPDSLELTFKMEYFNTASSKQIMEIIELCGDSIGNKENLIVKWYHKDEDEDMQEAGEDLQDITELNFEFFTM